MGPSTNKQGNEHLDGNGQRLVTFGKLRTKQRLYFVDIFVLMFTRFEYNA